MSAAKAVADPSVRLILSRSMQVEHIDEVSATIFLQSNGARVRLPRHLYNLLLMFEQPKAAASVAESRDCHSGLLRAISALHDKGFLVTEGEAKAPIARRPTTDPPVRLFDCPAQTMEPAQADVLILGVPYDQGDRFAAGAREGPAAVRETSLQVLYAIDRKTGRPRGWFDSDRRCAILRGIAMADCGDVAVEPGERQADLFGRISGILTLLTSNGALPVLLGGDASIGFPAVQVLQSRDPLAVIRFGTFPDRADGPECSSFVTPASLRASTLRLPGVTRYVHVGGGGSVVAAARGRPGWVSVQEAKKDGIGALKKHVEHGQKVYLGLGMDAVETNVTTPGEGESNAFSYIEMHALLCAIGAAYSIVGMDVVGLNPSKADWRVAAMTALHVLLTALSAAKDD